MSQRFREWVLKHNIGPGCNDGPEVLNYSGADGTVGDGWLGILDRMAGDLVALGWDRDLQQVQERFGRLQVIIGRGNAALYARVRSAEDESAVTCETCGAPGLCRNGRAPYTACDAHTRPEDVGRPPVRLDPVRQRLAPTLPACGQPLDDHCVLHRGHNGPCRSVSGQRADRLLSALRTLLDELRDAGGTFHERKAARRAERALEEPLLRDPRRDPDAVAAARARVEERQRQRDADAEVVDPDAFSRGVDTRRPVVALLAAIRAALPELERLLSDEACLDAYEDAIYRLYHHSFKVFTLQSKTARILAALQALAPERALHPDFLAIMADGTGQAFTWSTNERWMASARPIVEAYWHARHMLELAVWAGRHMEEAPTVLPSGWATLLYLYDLR